MKRAFLSIIAGTILAAAASAPAIAHHSAAMFDMTKTISVSGTVKDFQYTNPHSWLVIMAPGPDGKDVEWSFEAEGPSTLLRNGIKRSSLPPGEKVVVRTHPMKDGRPAGAWIDVTRGDGTKLDPHGAPPPGSPEAGATAPAPAAK